MQKPTLAISPQELETFLDRYFDEQMAKLHIPGAVFVLVKDGEVFLTKGYGFADLEKQMPIIPDKTLFRVGSISKLFTATAVMQLVEQEQLNLDDDVNQYLQRFQLENNYSQPVTVANLLTHTGGFDEQFIGVETWSESKVMPLGEYFAARMPPRVMPPRDTFSYSNHGMGLAGYLVEVVSGVPFNQYIDENILQPLDMHRSSFQLPPHLAPDLATGYEYNNGTYQAVPFSYIKVPPGGSLNATATDMAHFMIAHLQDGCYGNSRILNQATAQAMHRQQFTHHPRLPGFTYGFFERFENNQRAIEHGSAVRGFASLLLLLPEQNLGFFVACNNLEAEFAEELVSQFLDHYYPVVEQPAPPQPPADFQKRADCFTGHYRSNRYSQTTIQKLNELFSQIRVTASNGTLTIPSLANGETHQWVEVEPLLFQQLDDDSFIAFRKSEQGHITHMFMGVSAFEKLPWYETSTFHLSLLGFCLLVFLSACIVSLLPGVGFQSPDFQQLPELLAGLVSGLNLIFFVGLIIALSNQWRLVYGASPVVVALLFIPLLTTVFTVGLPIFTVLAWKNGYWSFLERLHYSLITLAAIAFIVFLRYWNLLGFRF